MQDDLDPEVRRLKALRGRNIALALTLVGLALLFYFITISKISGMTH